MKIVLRVALLAVVVALGYGVWAYLFPSPQHVVRNRLTKLARLTTTPAKEGNVARGLDLEKLGTMFSDDVQIILDLPGVDAHTFDGRDELMQGLSLLKSPGNPGTAGGGVKVEFPDISVLMAPGDLSARADVTLKAKIEGQGDLIVQEMKFTLKKSNGNWLISRVETIPTLKP